MTKKSGSHLFTYGSLMFPEVWQRVVGLESEGSPVVLQGYTAFRVRGQVYPGLTKGDSGSATSGILYRNLSEEDWEKLDAFEGTFYRRVDVEVEGENGIEQVQTYLVEDAHRDDLSSEIWDKEKFAEEGLKLFMRNYVPESD